MQVFHAIGSGLGMSVGFFWDSLFGLIFGFLISAIVQVAITPATMHRYFGANLKGIVYGAGFGIISSSCSYSSAAAARAFYQKGADLRSIFSFLISSTNMNLAILILFWTLLGWRFAFAEFFGGIVIIIVVAFGLTVLFGAAELDRLRREHPPPHRAGDMQHDEAHGAHGEGTAGQGVTALRKAETWGAVGKTALNDVRMLRADLIGGYILAGFGAALIPQEWLSGVLRAIGSIPIVGYAALLAAGLVIAVVTFVCSMGNVPVARYLALAGIPLGANTSFIYGDLLVPPLVAIYRKSFPARVTWTFVGLFALGAMIAGAVMDLAIGGFGGVSPLGSMLFNDRFTLVSNVVGIAAVIAVSLAAVRAKTRAEARPLH